MVLGERTIPHVDPLRMNMKMIKLNNNCMMPLIGLGTYKVTGEIMYSVLEAALRSGYRAIDTAWGYRNESFISQELAKLLPSMNLKMSDIFLTSKLPPKHHGYEQCVKSCLESLDNLQVPCLDLYLIHWPGAPKMKLDDPRHAQLRRESWKAMEDLVTQGKIKSIGVSNYTQRHLEELLSFCRIKPAVLQVEYHPHLVQTDLVDYCRQNNIHFQAYSSLGTSAVDNKLLSDHTVKEIGKKYQKTAAQVLLRWAVQQGIGVIPKSSTPAYIQQNIDIFDFELSPEDMNRISRLDQGTHYCWYAKDVL